MAFREGLYKIEFRTPLGLGAGVVVLEGGRLRGGDSSMFYVGTYSLEADKISATAQVRQHSGTMPSVFGVNDATVVIHGALSGEVATLDGSSPQAPGVKLSASLKRLGD